MADEKKAVIDYDSSVEIADGIFWVGFYDTHTGLHCHPYLIVDGDEALVIDGGSRPDFSSVMMKILRSGIAPRQIGALLYQHYDPDLCGSIPNFENIINRKDLKIISAAENLMFIQHYAASCQMLSINAIDYRYTFSSGRALRFIRTPFAHSHGSFVTFDPKSGILFSSDLFGSASTDWELFLELGASCLDCADLSACPEHRKICPIDKIADFHRKIMPSGNALKYAIENILKVPFTMIAPQHGSILKDNPTIGYVVELLSRLNGVGIDGIVGADYVFDFGNLNERFK